MRLKNLVIISSMAVCFAACNKRIDNVEIEDPYPPPPDTVLTENILRGRWEIREYTFVELADDSNIIRMARHTKGQDSYDAKGNVVLPYDPAQDSYIRFLPEGVAIHNNAQETLPAYWMDSVIEQSSKWHYSKSFADRKQLGLCTHMMYPVSRGATIDAERWNIELYSKGRLVISNWQKRPPNEDPAEPAFIRLIYELKKMK